METATKDYTWRCVCGQSFTWREISQFNTPGYKEIHEHRETCNKHIHLFKKGDIVAEKGYKGEYLVISYNPTRLELTVADYTDIGTLSSCNAYVVKRASYKKELPPPDAEKRHHSGRSSYHSHHTSYSED